MSDKVNFISPKIFEEIADIAREDCELDEWSVDVSKVAIKFNCEVDEVIFEGTNNDISGMIYYDFSNKKFCIDIDTSDSEARKRFTIAHELGHRFLHDEELTKNGAKAIVDYRRSLAYYENPDDITKEIQANMLAAAILMPKEKFEKAYELTKGNIDEIADLFNVSKKAASVRLESLGKYD